jgi:hypothetical protein
VEELWYPAFGLIDDPFQTTDFYSDRAIGAPTIPTRFMQKIQFLRGLNIIKESQE